jgi:hypothetical protein
VEKLSSISLLRGEQRLEEGSNSSRFSNSKYNRCRKKKKEKKKMLKKKRKEE